jgi:hypothetical protein
LIAWITLKSNIDDIDDDDDDEAATNFGRKFKTAPWVFLKS